MRWITCGKEFWRTLNGRFDLFSSEDSYGKFYVALDADHGRVFKTRDIMRAQKWVAEQAKIKKKTKSS